MQLTQNTGAVTYTPDTGFTGDDQFTFKVNDGKADSTNTGTVKIAVSSQEEQLPPTPAPTPLAPNNSSQCDDIPLGKLGEALRCKGLIAN